MTGIKSTLVRKKINDRQVQFDLPKSNRTRKIISVPTYVTEGEEFIVVRGIENCLLILDGETTSDIQIKSLTNTTIKSKQGRIDEYYDEIFIDNKACVQLMYLEGNWYVSSSDGMKLD